MKIVQGQRKLRGWERKRLTWKMDSICEQAVAKVEFSGIFGDMLKFWNTFTDFAPLIWFLKTCNKMIY